MAKLLFVMEGPSRMDLMLAQWDDRGRIPRLLRFSGRTDTFCSRERWASMGKDSPFRGDLEEAVLIGSDRIEKDRRHSISPFETIDAGSFLIRGWMDEGRTERFEGWYDPRIRRGVLEIKPKGE